VKRPDEFGSKGDLYANYKINEANKAKAREKKLAAEREK
jgi:hypothetical protein